MKRLTRLHKRQSRNYVCNLVRNVNAKSGIDARSDDLIMRSRTKFSRKKNEWLRSKRRQRDTAPACERVACWEAEQPRLARYALNRQFRSLQRQDDKPNMNSPLLQSFCLLVRPHAVKFTVVLKVLSQRDECIC